MHNVLFSVVYIKRGEGAKALNISIYMHIHVYAPQDVSREITTSTQGNGSDQLLFWGLYVSANDLRRAEANWLAGLQELGYFDADVWCEWKTIPAY